MMPYFPPGSEHFIAIDSMACFPAPSLKLGDGTLATFVYNHPSHILGPRAGIEMWVSNDGSQWHLRGLTTAEDVDWAHANWAVGINDRGQLLVAAARYRLIESEDAVRRRWIGAVVRRSDDNGCTWTTVTELPQLKEGWDVMPFGVMTLMPDGLLIMSCYAAPREAAGQSVNTAFVYRSNDGGRSWGDASFIEENHHNETGILCLAGERMLAASRTLTCPMPDVSPGLAQFLGGRLDLFESCDLGRSWNAKAVLTFPGQHPGHLIQLRDGRILLTYGSRMPGLLGVHARLSEDGGQNWSDPIMLINGMDCHDCGYPATLELNNGYLVTVYYSPSSPWHRRYHMAALRYPPDLLAGRSG